MAPQHDDNYPHLVSDPAADGIPEYADADSTADERVPSVREADGPDPAALPADRDEGPLALDEFGVTAQEQHDGESLDARLSREEPDVLAEISDADRPNGDTGSSIVDDEQAALDRRLADRGPVDPHLESQVSMYERMGDDPVSGGTVGRLVAPDEGLASDEEADAVAYDAGPAGGGASAEELAMHEEPGDRP
ncbi:DUF5709 domain-containing protein [Catellatospora sp. KI3]|uniref:DUF5709 domain-containing protein n=1 Tax=Catellatospora sp. KI3 TaxID=3041620 RepID=UPI002482E9E0|nr:DUF5709 domain-containing protein [Catellatospora sp. KI3]MDI1460910.1 DUF5709 domain-containing protein [Catellatospora sp. KI3]